MRTTRMPTLAAALTLTACLTEPTRCPPHHERMRALCVEVDRPEDDAGDTQDADLDADADGAAFGDDAGLDAAVVDAGDADASDGAAAALRCYLDYDRDGVGAGAEVPCPATDAEVQGATADAAAMTSADAAPISDAGADAAPGDAGDASLPAISHRNDDCDDHDAKRSPLQREICDSIDNNCNDLLDDNARNACGGSCDRVIAHATGEACDNGLRGNCARTGKYVCQGETDTVCNAPNIPPSTELCGDNVDNDCDGATDEPDGVNAPTWYQDCDGDGFAASTTGARTSCTAPTSAGGCGWTATIPVPPPPGQSPTPSNQSNWDCNDGSTLYKPGAAFGVPTGSFTSWDFTCDGVLTPDPAPAQDSGSSLFICADTIITNLNNNHRQCSPTNDARWNNCYFWVGANGLFTNEPPTKCPDNNARQLDVREGVDDPWGFNTFAPRHATTCRSAGRRAPLASRVRPLHSDEQTSTTPSAWICTVKTVGPAWPCR